VVLVIEGEERINEVLGPVYAALGLDWNPAATGSVRGEEPSADWGRVSGAIVTEHAREYDVVEAELDEETLALARELAAEHRVEA
jgi:hypothetical protein